MNLLRENTKLNINMIKIIDNYMGLTYEFLKKLEIDHFKITKKSLFMVWGYNFIGLFTSKKLAKKYLLRYMTNSFLSITGNIQKKYFQNGVFRHIDSFTIFKYDSLNMSKKIYLNTEYEDSRNLSKYLTNNESLAKKYNDGKNLYEIEIDPKLPKLLTV